MSQNFSVFFELQKIPGIGLAKIKKLAQHIKPIEKIKNCSIDDLCQIDGISYSIANKIYSKISQIQNVDEKIFSKLKTINYTTLADDDYPKLLFDIYDPPPILFYKGTPLKNEDICIAVVGTRNPTPYGVLVAELITKELVEAGIVIVSGLAVGIDTIAHKTALKYKGKTCAVLAGTLDKIYPSSNSYLAKEIIDSGGALLTENLFEDEQFGKWNFPRRNRIISGISSGVVVIEGAKNSGALITADFALEQNRDVFAVPGGIFSKKSEGPNFLIKNGAKLVETAKDILEEIPLQINYKVKNENFAKFQNFSDEEKSIIQCLQSGPKNFDFLVENTKIPFENLTSLLLSMQMNGVLREIAPSIFVSVV